ncbi:MAG: phosphate transport system regulatory protein PhoU [Puniceicoccaceae bacterium]|nr:MAG: phosphate transport system regulatory protein PhoU [Puniceicoccaceae bacterium]
MKRFFDEELDLLREHLTTMGRLANEAVRLAIRALLQNDRATAEKVIAEDDALDRLETEIDTEGIRFLNLRSPVASDLRLIMVAMKASHDLERVGDEATNIAKRSLAIGEFSGLGIEEQLRKLADTVLEMLGDALQCFFTGDEQKAIAICTRDAEADRLNKEIYRHLAGTIADQPSHTTTALELMFVSKSLERIGDHATNLAEEVVFLVKGENISHDPEIKQAKLDHGSGD